MKKYVYAVMFGLFIGTVAGISEATEKSKTQEPGRCYREVSFNETTDGSFVIRSAWRCESKVNKVAKDKVK